MKKVFIKMNGIVDVNEFVKNAREVEGDVLVTRGCYCIDGKSILGMFSIDTSQGCFVEYDENEVKFDTFLKQFMSD